MNVKLRAFFAGAVGAVLAFGIVELVHGLYQLVPSVFLSLAQLVIRLTPGGFATRAIEILGTADIPILIASMVVGTLIASGLLAYLALRSPLLSLVGVSVLAAIAIIVTLAEPFADSVLTVVTILVALSAGVTVSAMLLRSSGLDAAEPTPAASEEQAAPAMAGVRSREAHSSGGIAVGRRNFLLLGGGAAAAGLAAVGVGRLLAGGGAAGESSAPKALNLGGGDTSGGDTTGGGTTGVVKNETLPPPPDAASLEVEGMPPLITPVKDFYLIDAAITSPRINVDEWSLKIKGSGVQNPLEMSYKDLLSMSTRESDVTLSCVSNEVGGGLVSNGRWTGVLLSDVLREAGVNPEKINRSSEQLVGRSVDGWTGGFKTELAFDGRDALVAFGMNDSELPVKHGYPVRLVVPGLYGYVSATKWLTEIELTNWDFDAYWIQRTWTKKGPVKTQSRIDTVKGGESLSTDNVPIGGVAWAPHRGISRVEVSTDDGDTWNEARLAEQLDIDSWRQYVYEWDTRNVEPGDYTLKVRATDGKGETQTSETRPPHGGGGTDGATGYHTVEVSVA